MSEAAEPATCRRASRRDANGEPQPRVLGAHVSVAGGVDRAPGRAEEIGAAVFQIFTKQPNRWADPVVADDRVAAFRSETARAGVTRTVSHDSYLINLASPRADLWRRSADSFRRELERAALLGLDAVVTHPGNATDGDRASGISRNAAGVAQALEAVPAGPRVLLELTSGSGTSVGGTFEELASIIARIPEPHRARVGVCFDTCHAWVAGLDLRNDFDGVWMRADDTFGVRRVEVFHLNDAKAPFGSHLDRHEHIGKGTIGIGPFRRLMNEDRFRDVPKILETPKGDDGVTADRENLAVLRGLRGELDLILRPGTS
ncbi:MAG: deoxyribonuclease IV [Gemmatimonadota bacterium]|nr:deoxyribonuclease IV [Gemmatimonadota bacterium]